MASRTISLLKLIANRGIIIRGSKVPFSWASVDVMGDTYAQDQEHEEQVSESVEDEHNNTPEEEKPSPIRTSMDAIQTKSPSASVSSMRQSRMDFSREYWRSLVHQTVNSSGSAREVEGETFEHCLQANLGENHLYYAQ